MVHFDKCPTTCGNDNLTVRLQLSRRVESSECSLHTAFNRSGFDLRSSCLPRQEQDEHGGHE